MGRSLCNVICLFGDIFFFPFLGINFHFSRNTLSFEIIFILVYLLKRFEYFLSPFYLMRVRSNILLQQTPNTLNDRNHRSKALNKPIKKTNGNVFLSCFASTNGQTKYWNFIVWQWFSWSCFDFAQKEMFQFSYVLW